MPSNGSQESVVLRFRDGRTQRCVLTSEFRPRHEDVLTICDQDGQELSVALDELKAVFFLKSPRRREVDAHTDTPADVEPGMASARVEFFDGEIIRGRVQNYSVADRGFFLYPTAVDSNNARIFVVASALTTLAIEG